MTRCGWLMALAIVVAGGAGRGAGGLTAQAPAAAPPRAIDVATADAGVRAAMARADEAMGELQRTLQARLTAAMTEGGPRAAVAVCRDEAQVLTTRIATARGVALGRTSDRVRNVANAPRAWAVDVVAAHAGHPVAGVQPQVFDLGGRIGMLKPIGTQPLCVTCHGPRDVVDGAIGEVVRSAYPDDRAVGYQAGQLRGWFWAEVPLP